MMVIIIIYSPQDLESKIFTEILAGFIEYVNNCCSCQDVSHSEIPAATLLTGKLFDQHRNFEVNLLRLVDINFAVKI